MTATTGNIVTVNAGSSSIKLAVYKTNQHIVDASSFATILISNIGQPKALLEIIQPTKPTYTEEFDTIDHSEATHMIIGQLANIIAPASIMAIGHRLVHGGMKYADPMVINTIPDTDWELLSRLDPDHTPAAHELINQFSQHYPSVLQIACFDTAFFQQLPHIAKLIPIPRKYYDEGVRRYGFHGLSYTSLLATFQEKAGDIAMNGRVVLAHLGSGASLAATYKGKPIDTTMGFTPTSGIIMSTRSGDLDPNIFGFLHTHSHMDIEEFNHMVSSQSGLLGVSGLTGDMHALLDLEKQNGDAAMAVELFIRDVRKSIGALTTTLGGINSLIFSGGIGEQSAIIRARICQDLEYMGIEINVQANEENNFLISSQKSSVGVHVIPADEAHSIAVQIQELLLTKESDRQLNYEQHAA
ncbi:MAG: Acetate kinase [Candidatus Saccharibacteria bacterium]|nr:Acetate kinase [Candidatus Saccharibacteria bacterium]